jgi:hypothetical protein
MREQHAAAAVAVEPQLVERKSIHHHYHHHQQTNTHIVNLRKRIPFFFFLERESEDGIRDV